MNLKDNYSYCSHGTSFLKRECICHLPDVLASEKYLLLGCDAMMSGKIRGGVFLRNMEIFL
jgi:hypothetical protein